LCVERCGEETGDEKRGQSGEIPQSDPS
jgi:hypothetical protein